MSECLFGETSKPQVNLGLLVFCIVRVTFLLFFASLLFLFCFLLVLFSSGFVLFCFVLCVCVCVCACVFWLREVCLLVSSIYEFVDEEIEKMVKEAEANKEADKKKRDLVEAKNQAETLTHQIEKQLKEHGDKISAEEKKAIEDAKTEVTESVKSEDADKIKAAVAKLTEASMKLGEAVYKQAQADQQKQEAPSDGQDAKDEKVVDAEFEEVDKDKDDKKE